MAKAPAKKQNAKVQTAAKDKANKSIGRAMLAVLTAGVIAFFFLSTMIVLLCGMLPTIAAYMIDANAKKYAARTVGVLNFAGCMPIAAELWAGGQTIDFAVELLLDPFNWLIMLGAAAIGWVLYFTLPPVVGTYLAISFESRIKSETDKQEGLVKEWGTDVAQRAPVDQLEAIEEQEKMARQQAKREKKRAEAEQAAAAAAAKGASQPKDNDFDDEDEDVDEEEEGRAAAVNDEAGSKAASA